MHDYHPTILSTDDHDRLQAMMCTMIGARTPLAHLLRRKLGSAIVMLPGDISPDIVTSGRQVRFRTGRHKRDERRLVWDGRGDEGELPLSTTRGLSLLGLATGQSISFLNDRRRTETLTVEFVFPEQVAAPVEMPVAILDGRVAAAEGLA